MFPGHARVVDSILGIDVVHQRNWTVHILKWLLLTFNKNNLLPLLVKDCEEEFGRIMVNRPNKILIKKKKSILNYI